MIPTQSWFSVLVAGGVGVYLLGPARTHVETLPRALAAFLLVVSAGDLIRLGTGVAPEPWSHWTVLLVLPVLLVVVLRRPIAQPEAPSQELLWREALDGSQDPFAVIDAERRVHFANLAWQAAFEGRRLEELLDLLDPLIEQAADPGRAEGTVDLMKLPWLEKSNLLEEIDEPVPLRVKVVRAPADNRKPDGELWMILLEGSRAKGLAVCIRRLAHNINNMLSAAVGGAGMAMDLVPESSDVHRELTEIEDVAMRASEVTAELQSLAREVVPPPSLPRP